MVPLVSTSWHNVHLIIRIPPCVTARAPPGLYMAIAMRIHNSNITTEYCCTILHLYANCTFVHHYSYTEAEVVFPETQLVVFANVRGGEGETENEVHDGCDL